MVRPHRIGVNTEPGGDGGLKGNVKSVSSRGDHLRIEVAIGAQVVEVTQTATPFVCDGNCGHAELAG